MKQKGGGDDTDRRAYLRQQQRNLRARQKQEYDQKSQENENLLISLESLKIQKFKYICYNLVLQYCVAAQKRIDYIWQWCATNNQLDEETQRKFSVNLGLPLVTAPVRMYSWNKIMRMSSQEAIQLMVSLYQDAASTHDLQTSPGPATATAEAKAQYTINKILFSSYTYSHDSFVVMLLELVKNSMENKQYIDDVQHLVDNAQLTEQQLCKAYLYFQMQLQRHLRVYQERENIIQQSTLNRQTNSANSSRSEYIKEKQTAQLLSLSVIQEKQLLCEWEHVIPKCIGANNHLYINIQLFPQKLEMTAFGHALCETAEKQGVLPEDQANNIRTLEHKLRRFLDKNKGD